MFRIDRLESLVTQSLRARTERSIKKQIEDGDSKIIIKEVLSFTLNEKGSFVREILLDEFAKGLDALGLAAVESVASTVTANIPFFGSQSFSLMNNEDIKNLRTLRRLVLLLSGLRENDRRGVEIREASAYNSQRMFSTGYSLVLYQPLTMQEIQPVLAVIAELPQDLQQQLLQLPAGLAARFVSRIAARTIRRIFL